jgi:hypothetical protein
LDKGRQTYSQLLRGYGAVLPIHKPEDFRALREAFEESVAEEVVSSFNRPEFPVGEERLDSTIEE